MQSIIFFPVGSTVTVKCEDGGPSMHGTVRRQMALITKSSHMSLERQKLQDDNAQHETHMQYTNYNRAVPPETNFKQDWMVRGHFHTGRIS